LAVDRIPGEDILVHTPVHTPVVHTPVVDTPVVEDIPGSVGLRSYAVGVAVEVVVMPNPHTAAAELLHLCLPINFDQLGSLYLLDVPM
jgi:hypothetical protein